MLSTSDVRFPPLLVKIILTGMRISIIKNKNHFHFCYHLGVFPKLPKLSHWAQQNPGEDEQKSK